MYIHQLKIKSEIIPGYLMNENSEIYSIRSNKILKPFQNKEGRPTISLIHNNGKKYIRLDYLVISTLGKFYDDIIHIIHIDDDDMNCNINNLTVVRKSDIVKKYLKLYNVSDLIEIPEEWKLSKSYQSVEISNFGNIRDYVSKTIVTPKLSHGYYLIYNGTEHYHVHRLVAEEFVENPRPDKYFYINHIDGNKINNSFYNLEWCNISMNTEHAVLTGLTKSHDESVVRSVCELLSEGLPHIEISKITGVSRKYISDIYRGRRRKNISSQYTFNRKIPLSDLYNEDAVVALLKSGYSVKNIANILKINDNDSFRSYCTRLRNKF